MSFKLAKVFLAAAVATNGTISVPYPSGTDSGTFTGTYAHKAWASGLQNSLSAPAGFTVSFGTSDITVTYKGSTSLPAGSYVNFQFDTIGSDGDNFVVQSVNNVSKMTPIVISLGAPDVADADGVCVSASYTALLGGTIGGALASGGVATFDRPRNVVAAWTGTSVITVTGTDEYGNVVKESSASGTSLAGKKAFKTVTAVAFSADVTSCTVGTGDVLGLPVVLPQVALVVKELQDGAAATAGTLVAAVALTATATTGDVRGTYDPNAACDGAKSFQLLAFVPNANDRGVSQYAG